MNVAEKAERKAFLFWFYKELNKKTLLLSEKETAWAGWINGLKNSGKSFTLSSTISCSKGESRPGHDHHAG